VALARRLGDHLAAKVALEAGVSVKVVSERLGHRDANFTLQVYMRTVKSQHRKAAMDTTTLYGAKPNPESGLDTKPKKMRIKKLAKPKGRKKPSATSLPPRAKKRKKQAFSKTKKPRPGRGFSWWAVLDSNQQPAD
jgi:hypothetical protein